MSTEQISVDDGKYTIIYDRGVMTALRHGEPWNRDINGDKLIYTMFARIRELEDALKLSPAAPGAAPQDASTDASSTDAASESERILQAIGDAAHRVGIYNGTAPLSGPLAIMLLNDMVTQSGLGPREILSSAKEEARALGAELAAAAQHDDNDPEGHDISAGLLGPNVSAWLRKLSAERLAARVHPESGMTADELWMEAGRLRARMADMKVEMRAQAKADAYSAARAGGIPPSASRVMRPMSAGAGQVASHATKVFEHTAAATGPDFAAVRDKRMCDLTPEQQRDARELWLREQLAAMPDYHRDHYKFLLSRLDEARGDVNQSASERTPPAQQPASPVRRMSSRRP